MRHRRFILFIAVLAALGLAVAAVRVPPLFIASDRCLACHNGLVTPRGEDISIGADWRASMMANAARDPYWQAAVRREILSHPKAAAAIEHECSACHMPMAATQAKADGGQGRVFVHLPVVPASGPGPALAVDGVSCTVCHQIGRDKLGAKESFTAGFVVDTAAPWGSRKIFGPYDVDKGRQRVDELVVGIPARESGPHPGLGALRHLPHALHPRLRRERGGRRRVPRAGPLSRMEAQRLQRPDELRCPATCPKSKGRRPSPRPSASPAKNVARHVFRGGNFFMPKLLNRHRDEPRRRGRAARAGDDVGPDDVPSAAVRRPRSPSAERRSRRARSGPWSTVGNLAGHKLPSAYPSRRAWVHFTVLDGSGATVFESGRFEADGSIAGNDNDADRTRFEPHYAEIRTPGRGPDLRAHPRDEPQAR
ncbi:MAG: cytochrome c family protein [Candidatus Moduliflexus flocculans]|nr:cytochrome c family protein [Candidatus Moduliflexus flocculans]